MDALVVGASRGLGRSLAVALARRGHRVTGTGRDEAALAATAALCEPLPGSFAGRILDVREAAASERLVAELEPLDLCVANAAIAEVKPFAETSIEDLRQQLEVNLVGAFAVLQAVAAGMVARGSGRLVAIASVGARTGLHEMAAYVASKHALHGLVRSLALELIGTGVGVTTVFPGPMVTEILGPLITSGMDPDDAAEAIAALAELGPSIGSCELHLEPDEEWWRD